MTFIENLFIVPIVPWRSWRMVLQLLDHERKFGVLQTFLENSLDPIWYNQGEGKEGPFLFILPGKSVNNHILFSLIVNDLIIISK
jgi:hypothetical protein